jgi:hypothetical protein
VPCDGAVEAFDDGTGDRDIETSGDDDMPTLLEPVAPFVNNGLACAGFVRPDAPVIVTRSNRRSSKVDVDRGGATPARAIIARASASTAELPLPSVFAVLAFCLVAGVARASPIADARDAG